MSTSRPAGSPAVPPASPAVPTAAEVLARLPLAPERSTGLPRWCTTGTLPPSTLLSLVVELTPLGFLVAAHRGRPTTRDAAAAGHVHLAFPSSPLRAALRRVTTTPALTGVSARLFGMTAVDGPATVSVGTFATRATYPSDALPADAQAIAGVGTVIPPGVSLVGVIGLHAPTQAELGHLVAALRAAAADGFAPVPGHPGRARCAIVGLTLGTLPPALPELLARLGGGIPMTEALRAATPEGVLAVAGPDLGPALDALAAASPLDPRFTPPLPPVGRGR